MYPLSTSEKIIAAIVVVIFGFVFFVGVPMFLGELVVQASRG